MKKHYNINLPSGIKPKDRVIVGLSGGVDSSVAAALLSQAGFDVIGVMLKLWSEPGCEDENKCCTPESINVAKRVASKLNIPFYVIDAKDSFFKNIVNYFIDSYSNTLTPNPCVLCNKILRWKLFQEYANATNAKYVASGHYALLKEDENSEISLNLAADQNKDQTYVLSFLSQEDLKRTILPLGSLTKPEVREIAEELELPSAKLKDSQDLCFITTGDYRDFLKKYAPKTLNPGPIVTLDGKKIGEHSGLAFYTIGQRKGLGVSAEKPLYVVDKIAKKNTLVVSFKDEALKNSLIVKDLNWIASSPPESSFKSQVKIRYKSSFIPSEVKIEGDRAYVFCESELIDITPGQACVFYDGDKCLGGGWIEKAISTS